MGRDQSTSSGTSGEVAEARAMPRSPTRGPPRGIVGLGWKLS